MKSGVFISGRNKSRRLPDKLFLPLQDSTTLEKLISRAMTSTEADKVIIATSDHPDDAVFGPLGDKMGIDTFYGSQDDKLLRYRDACAEYGLDFCVIVDADDLLADPWVIDEIIRSYRDEPADFIIMDDLPVGATGFGVPYSALKRIVEKKAENDTEIWGALFTEDPEFNSRMLTPPENLNRPHYRLTLDYLPDYEIFKAIYAALEAQNPDFTLHDVVAYLDENSDVAAINDAVKAEWEANLEKQIAHQKATAKT